jgi:DNA-binding response OmpR family regulator
MSMRVLVVDDDPQIRALMEVAFDDDVEVLAVADAPSAMRALNGRSFDCVVIDVMMPGMSGFQLLEMIRAEPSLRRMPAVMLTALAGDAQHVEAFHSGAAAYLTKPFDVEELNAVVREVVSLDPKERDRRRQTKLEEAELLARIETSFGRG